jgi:GNAT superfamily N-acetyltransferase
VSEHFLYTTVWDPRAKPLLEDLAFEYESRYGELYREDDGPPEMERYPPELFEPPDGNFLLLIRNGEALGGGAFMRYDGRTAEFKRIWTRRDLRRQGIARKVLAELEAQSVRQGYQRVYLTTGFRQPEAVGLYLGHGYTPLFERPVDPNVPRKLPFEKYLVRPASSPEAPAPSRSRASLTADAHRSAAEDARG